MGKEAEALSLAMLEFSDRAGIKQSPLIKQMKIICHAVKKCNESWSLTFDLDDDEKELGRLGRPAIPMPHIDEKWQMDLKQVECLNGGCSVRFFKNNFFPLPCEVYLVFQRSNAEMDNYI